LGVLARLCKSKFWEISIDRLRAKFRSIDFSGLPNFQVFPHEIFVIPFLLTYKTQEHKN